MRTPVAFLLCIVALCFLPMMSSSAQDRFPKRAITPFLPSQSPLERATRYTIPGKRASQYTAEDWGKVIDSTWGPGQGATEQLNIFDTFWDTVDQQYAGFANLPINWDSLRTVYRPQIGSGLSRGRFAALMSRMWLALLEVHTFIYDAIVDKTFGGSSNYVWQYKSGVPLLVIGTGWTDLLGAPATAMPDSSALVYRADPANPLGLEPGDLVLGYEGVPWKRLYRQLLDYGLPVSRYWSLPASTPESRSQEVLSGVGWNWSMFDTIDVVKYSTGDTVHLPTAPLATVTPTVWASDQVPIAGVPMPQGSFLDEMVSWGVVQGTNIGYVYAWDWTAASTPDRFANAIYDLLNNKKVEGLVIDFRFNLGGDPSFADGGLSQLFNFDPASNVSFAVRNSSTNHLGFYITSTWQFHRYGHFPPTASLFDRPIAVLIGPACLSGGDFTAFWMRFHPMARSFGKPTNGGFVAGGFATGSLTGGWEYQLPTSIGFSDVLGDGYLIHKGVRPDEEVWLTRDGVAKGEDDVVKRALQWIKTLSYAHDLTLLKNRGKPSQDSIRMLAKVENPLSHSLAVWSYLSDGYGVRIDSCMMYDDGLHGDSLAGDGWCGGRFSPPAYESAFFVSIRTTDVTAGTFRYLPNVRRFFTNGPIVCSGYTLSGDSIPNSGDRLKIRYRLANRGTTDTVRSVTATYSSLDAMTITSGSFSCGDMPPGAQTFGDVLTILKINASCPPGAKVRVLVNISSEGVPVWTDTASFTVMTGIVSENGVPTRFSLSQNFPNPFNPSTVIRYEVLAVSDVSLRVFDLLGREVATLVNERENPGTYEVRFDGTGLPSGVYFYRIQAGSFVETKKLVLLR